MTIFGGNWAGHPEIFFEEWQNTVGPNDAVIVAGDISWALKLPDAMQDLNRIASLPGKKILLRGNHDYWWPSISKLRAALPPNMFALQNDAVVIGNTAICGTRGWTCPGEDTEHFDKEDEKIYVRELERLRLAIKNLEGKSYSRLVIALHFPPFNSKFKASGFTDILEETKPDAVVFGHVHGADPNRIPKDWCGIPLHFVAADAVHFQPQVVLEEL